MLRFAFRGMWTAAAVVGAICAAAAAPAGLKAVPQAPGGFEPEGGNVPPTVPGKLLDAATLESLAGKPDGYDLLVHGESIFGLDYAHRAGRREPLRPLAADLSDWSKAPQCPPDRVLIDPRTGRIRFFPGHDPAAFHSRVVARFRGTHGDTAIAHWRGSTLFLSHWESAYHVWAYDVRDPSSPARIGELHVGNFAHGFAMLDGGWGLMGTTGPDGVFLLDLRNPRKMQVMKSLVPKLDWLDPITARYVAAWRGRRAFDEPQRTSEARVFDVSRLPGEFPEVTGKVPAEVRKYLAGSLGIAARDGAGWFRLGDESLAAIDLRGEPSAWRVLRTVKLPESPPLPTDPRNRRPPGQRIVIQTLVPGKRFVLLVPAGDLARRGSVKSRLQILDVSAEQPKFFPAIDVEPTAMRLSALLDRYAYLSVPPLNRGAGIVGTWEGTCLSIYDLSDPENIRQAGTWDPGFPTRNMELIPQPQKKSLVLVKEDSTGTGIHFADFSDPLRPKVLSTVPTNGEGNRVAAWGDRAMYTSSTEAQWIDLSRPLAPERVAGWFNHRWFHVLHVFGSRAVVSRDREAEVVDFSNPKAPREVFEKVSAGASWGTRLFEAQGGPRSGGGPIRLTIADMADPARFAILSQTRFPGLDTPMVAGLCADGPLLYGITQGKKGQAVFLIWDVADPKKPALLAQLRHDELQVERGDWFWTAQGHPLAAANGIAIVTSYGSGPPQVIDARNPRDPKFLMRLPYQGRWPHHSNEMSDCRPDGPWFFIKAYPDWVQLWDFSQPEKPRQIWADSGKESVYGPSAWQAGVPVGPVLLIPELPQLKVVTVPRPSQVPAGKVTWR